MLPGQLIVALDFDTDLQAGALVDQLDPVLCAVKVGNEMFTRYGTSFVKALVAKQFKVFLDLKFHDIPATVSRACKASADLGVWMLNVHALSGPKVMQTASEALVSYGAEKPLLVAITILTSMTQADLTAVGITTPLKDQVTRLATLAQASGFDGVVSSAKEVFDIKAACGSQFITVSPGIRLAGDATDDQQRVMTPQEALETGTDYLVIGRSITRAADPARVVANLLNQAV